MAKRPRDRQTSQDLADHPCDGAGLADHVWSLEEIALLVNLQDYPSIE